jgi:ferrochelatase
MADRGTTPTARPSALPILRSAKRSAVVLMNIGTPDAPTTQAVRRYLREFLSDPRVLDMPALGRALLLNLVILPTRPQRSAAQYRKVWTDEGSPLLAHSRALERGLQARLPHTLVTIGMRYGRPSIRAAVEKVQAFGADHVVLVPLYPQHASASTGSALQEAFAQIGALPRVPSVSVVPAFFDDAGFIDAVASGLAEATRGFTPDHVLFSYHGLPLRQVQATVEPEHRCRGVDAPCCEVLRPENASCYRAQSVATTRAVVEALQLDPARCSTSFQSRLGRTPWLLPSTEQRLDDLLRAGVKKLAVLCPSFVADCLETLEEIGVRAAEQWKRGGGGTEVAQAQHGGPVGHHGDGVALDRQAARVVRVLGDRLTHTSHTRRVRARQVVTVAQRHLRRDLDLAAEVHEERAVRHLAHDDAGQRLQRVGDVLGVVRGQRVAREVDDDAVGVRLDDVERRDHPAGAADGRGEVTRGAR